MTHTPSDTKLEPCPMDDAAFDLAIKDIGPHDDHDGHWRLDSGNLRYLVGQYEKHRNTPSPAKVMSERELSDKAFMIAANIAITMLRPRFNPDTGHQAIINLAKAYRDGAK